MTSRPKNWGSKALVMYRNYSNGFPSSASGFKVKNLLDTQKLQIGDIVTVKAWIWTQDMVIVDPGKTLNGIDPFVPINGLQDGADREAKSTSFVRMWLSKEDAYAFGDSNNDLPMLSYLPNSVSMGNAYPASLFDRVSFVTKKASEDGIAFALEHFSFL